jgi:TrmH family RNA methyltransferase
MVKVQIVLVSPLYEGNIGFSARVMKNFGFSDLVLVDPCKIGNDANARAAHAKDVLNRAARLTLEEVFAGSDIVVATTGAVSKSICRPMRMPYHTPRELRGVIASLDATVSILFGRENWGLSNDEVRRCDLICTIPASVEYPILNLSHAVGVVCYELANIPKGDYLLASHLQMDHLYRHIDRYLDLIQHPSFKREGTMIMVRRVLGRARLTAREVSTLHGILRRSEWYIPANDRQGEVRDKGQI